MDKFFNWFYQHYDAIVWFLIGWLAQACLVQISRGDYVGALFDLVLAYLNYVIYSRRKQ